MILDNDSLIRSFPVDAGETAVLKRGTRVKFLVTSSVVGLATADADDLAIGVIERDWNPSADSGAPAQGASVRLFGYPRVFIAASAIADATQLTPAAAGKVDNGIGYPYVTFKGAGADGEQVVGYKCETILFADPA
jgi:hypothetical protein